MTSSVRVHRARTNILIIDLGYDVSADTFESDIRSEPDHTSALIASWDVTFEGDGTNGRLRLELDDLIAGQITVSSGFMDLKRVTGGEPVAVFERPLEVQFIGVTTP